MNKKIYTYETVSDPGYLVSIESFIKNILSELNLSEEKSYGIQLAASEAITNAILHANKKDITKKVFISVSTEPNKLEISVRDQGQGFDPSTIPDPTQPENLLKDHGRGIYLMRIYSSSMEYKITPEGTELILGFTV